MDKYEEIAENVREEMEMFCAESGGDMTDYFTDGIYGEDGDGNWIVGFGVHGGANIVVRPDCVVCGGRRSAEFTPALKRSLAELRNLLENC